MDKVYISWDDTQDHKAVIEKAKIAEVEQCYQKAKNCIAGEKDFLHRLVRELLTKSTITQKDIVRIRENLDAA